MQISEYLENIGIFAGENGSSAFVDTSYCFQSVVWTIYAPIIGFKYWSNDKEVGAAMWTVWTRGSDFVTVLTHATIHWHMSKNFSKLRDYDIAALHINIYDRYSTDHKGIFPPNNCDCLVFTYPTQYGPFYWEWPIYIRVYLNMFKWNQWMIESQHEIFFENLLIFALAHLRTHNIIIGSFVMMKPELAGKKSLPTQCAN